MKESRTKERLLSLNDRHCARWCFICFTLFNPPNSTEVSVLPLFFKGGNTLREVSNITVPASLLLGVVALSKSLLLLPMEKWVGKALGRCC